MHQFSTNSNSVPIRTKDERKSNKWENFLNFGSINLSQISLTSRKWHQR